MGRVFQELKRRNVFRVAAAYLVAAWLVLQVADILVPILGLPDSASQVLVLLLVVGSPIVLLLSWFYELTPEGISIERDVAPNEAITQVTGRRMDFIVIALLCAAVILFSYDKWWRAPPEKSIAVLPFVNMSDDASNEYFSEGLSEELLNLLVKIPELQVAARTSSFSYKGKDTRVAQIGAELGVAYVLEGSVRKAGEQVRITAQLVKADDGFHLWSESYDQTLDDIFIVQDEIATAVVDALRVNLLGAMPEFRKTDPEVYSLYLQGNYFNNLRGEQNLQKAVAAFEQALAIDPDYAPAWVGISMTYSIQSRSRFRNEEQGSALAIGAVERALAIDKDMAIAWASLAYLKRSYELDWQGAKAAIDKALKLEPNNANVLGVAASMATTLGQLSEATELYEQTVSLDPLKLASLRALGVSYLNIGRFDEAIETLSKSVALNPADDQGRLNLGMAYLMKGDSGRALIELEMLPDGVARPFGMAHLHFTLGNDWEAKAYVHEFLDNYAHSYPVSMASIYVWRGENDSAFEWMETAFQQGSADVAYFLSTYFLANLKSDPRYPVFAEKLGLLEAWNAMPLEYRGPLKSPN